MERKCKDTESKIKNAKKTTTATASSDDLVLVAETAIKIVIDCPVHIIRIICGHLQDISAKKGRRRKRMMIKRLNILMEMLVVLVLA